MKKIQILSILVFVLTGCSSVKFVDSWKNEQSPVFKPQKLLVVGVTDNLTARKIFESTLKSEFLMRNIETHESSVVFNSSFSDDNKTEKEINDMIVGLSEKGFDAVIISAVKGVDDRKNYTKGYYTINTRLRRFGRYYYYYQDIYHNPGYYNEYKVYHVETSIYNLTEEDDRSLIWVGAIDIVDPKDISKTVNEYVNAIITRLEKDGIIRIVN